MKLSKLNRVTHRWRSIIVLIPTAVILFSGIVLQLKKEMAWIQPPTRPGAATDLSLNFDQILAAARKVPEAKVGDWDDIDRLDVRPSKGMLGSINPFGKPSSQRNQICFYSSVMRFMQTTMV
jgi:hypothetical protein